MDEKHETGPIDLIKILSMIIGEYNLMLMNDTDDIEAVDVLAGDFDKVLDRVTDLGRVNLHCIAILCSLQTIVSNHGTLLGESLYVLSLTREEALRNQHWEVSILYTCLLKHLVKLCLNLLPDSIAVWLDNRNSRFP